jgi:5-methylcytosine-specific restriction endonuclease McrBC GTP-binding regulatory subunit McrB
MQILDFNPIKEPLESKLSNFTDELFNIKQRISKVDIKNSFFSLDSCCNSFISLEKSQSMQSSKIESKSHKSSLNVSSIKSIEKGLISTFSITSPRKS